jgi:addiction module HigA family antidote
MLPTHRKPTHPGEILNEEFLKPLKLTAAQLASQMGARYTEEKINALINGNESLSDAMATALSKALGTSSHFWKHLQHLCTEWESLSKLRRKAS